MEIAEFNWITSLFGGFLLGLSAMLLLVFRGDVAGINGMVSGVLSFKWQEMGWRINFIIGLILGVVIYQWVYGSSSLVLEPLVDTQWVIFAGFIVGIGATIGNGCTSGHGICGISRFSMRSIVATITFISTGIVTVYLVHHVGVLG
jgi:uncharacterized protein